MIATVRSPDFTHKFYIDGYMRSNLDIIQKEAIPAKWDCLSIYLGREGVGKTTLVLQHALYLDPKLTLEYVVFSPNQFLEAIEKAPPGSSVVWDEAITGANAQQHAQQIAISIISKLTQIRKKNLKIFLCFPYLYMLNRYFINRALFSVYVYAKDFKDRGYFRFYSQPKTEKLLYLMKDTFSYSPNKAFDRVISNFYGRFSKYFPLDEIEYDKKKEKSRQDWQKNSGLWRDRFVQTLLLIKNDDSIELPISRVAEELGLSRQTLYEMMKKAIV